MNRWLQLFHKMNHAFRALTPPLAIFLVLFLCCDGFFPAPTFAAGRRVLLQLYNLRQWVDVSTAYTGTVTDNGQTQASSQRLKFEESHNVGIEYAILHKNLAHGSLEFELGSDQDILWQRSGNESSAGYRLEYTADMFLLEKSPYPVLLSSRRTQQLIASPFTESYEQINSHFSSRLTLHHDLVPVDISYSRTNSETLGLTVDRTQFNQFFAINASLRTLNFSKTHLGVRTSSGKTSLSGGGQGSQRESYQLLGSNSLSWDFRSVTTSLDSRYRLREESGNSNLDTVDWEERLNLQLGSALRSNLVYGYGKMLTDERERRSVKWSGWVEHRLFKSLTTHLGYADQHNDEDSGTVDLVSRNASVSYVKKLPAKSQLSLSYGYSYAVADSNLDIETLAVNREELTVSVAGNLLQNTDVLLDTIRVYSEDRLTEYRPGIDYDVVPIGRVTRLEFVGPGLTGLIAPGDVLSIDYSFQSDGSIEYATTGNSVSAALSFLDNRYRVSSHVSTSEQDLIEGEPKVTSLGTSLFYDIGIDGDFSPYRTSLKYRGSKQRDSSESAFDASLGYRKHYGTTDVSVHLNESYSQIVQKRSTFLEQDVETSTNYLGLLFDYRKNYSRNLKLKSVVRLSDLRGDTATKDELKLGFGAEYRWYKFVAILDSSVTWLWSGPIKQRNDNLYLTVRRYF